MKAKFKYKRVKIIWWDICSSDEAWISEDDILNHEWLASKLEESWNTNLNGGKLMRCSRTCGNEYSPIMSQSQTKKL